MCELVEDGQRTVTSKIRTRRPGIKFRCLVALIKRLLLAFSKRLLTVELMKILLPLYFHENCRYSPKMTAENKNENVSGIDISMIEEMANDYSGYLTVDASKQVTNHFDTSLGFL